VTSCAGANGLDNMMLFGTPLEVQPRLLVDGQSYANLINASAMP
jgi:hypothetical protein